MSRIPHPHQGSTRRSNSLSRLALEPARTNGEPAWFTPEHNAWLERDNNWPQGTVLELYQERLAEAADRVIATSTPAPPPAYERAVGRVAQDQQTAEGRLAASRAFHNPEYERMDRVRNGRVVRPLPLDRAYYIRNPLPDEAWMHEAGEDIGTLFGRLETAVERRRNARLEDGALVRPSAMSTIRRPSWSTLGNQRPLEDREPSPGRARRNRMHAWIEEHRRTGHPSPTVEALIARENWVEGEEAEEFRGSRHPAVRPSAAVPTACHVTSNIPPQRMPKGHPIDALIIEAERQQDAVFQNATTRLEDGMDDYRRRRGRPPPPGFDTWYARASKSSPFVVESFFDQIYEDLEPFWGISPGDIRNSISTWDWTLKLRNGKVRLPPRKRFRTQTWARMIEELSPGLLPDMDIPVNYLDEPRVFAPWDVIDKSVSRASAQKEGMMQLSEDAILRRAAKPISEQHSSVPSHPEWITKGDIWPHVLDTCPPSATPELEDVTYLSATNWTAAKDVCANQHWADLHGALIRPASITITTNLIPIFSAAKLQGSNDILLPPPSYYSDDSLFTGGGWFGEGLISTPWHKKIHGLIWRGKATGGRIHHSKWRNFHRQRLVSMLNGSEIIRFEDDEQIRWPNVPEGGSEGTKDREDLLTVSTWLHKVSDAAFTDLFLPKKDRNARDRAIAKRYKVQKPISMPKQYNYKYLPDIDGNSLSGRFRAFLRSNSSPMKATIFKEWHDSRLIPWAHFIPIDITLRDLWSTMAYFLGYAEVPPHDIQGNVIACNGRTWAETVLRKEDMLLYTYRVLLEFARICDDERDKLGFVLE